MQLGHKLLHIIKMTRSEFNIISAVMELTRFHSQLLLICFILFQTSQTVPPPGYTYSPAAEGWLKVHEEPAPWHEATMSCRKEDDIIHPSVGAGKLITFGGYLLSPLSVDLRNAMQTAMQLHGNLSAVHTGLQYNSLTESDFNSEVWRSIPHDKIKANQEDVLVMWKNGTLMPVDEKKALPYICFQKVEKSCGDDKDYLLDKTTGQCLKLFHQKNTWSAALTRCTEDGGSLAVINSEDEAKTIRNLFSKKPESLKDHAWLGVALWIDDRWRAVDGTSLEETGYSKFKKGEPSNQAEYCGSVDSEGLLHNDECQEEMAFICEKEAQEKVVSPLDRL